MKATVLTRHPLARTLLVLLGLLAMGWLGARMLESILNAPSGFSDFHAYYRAAANIRAGQDIYAEGKLLVERNSIHFWSQTDGQYVYPPLLAFAFVPLTVVDMPKASYVWLVALVGAALGFVWAASHLLGRPLRFELAIPAGTLALAAIPLLLATRYAHPRSLTLLALGIVLSGSIAFVAWGLATGGFSRPSRDDLLRLVWLWPIVIVVLGSSPLALGIKFGQPDIILTLLTTLALLIYVRGHDALAGVALGLAAAVKPTLALYGLYFLRKRRWTTLGSAALTGAVLGLAPFALLPAGAFGDWLTISRHFTGEDYPVYPSNQSARGLLMRVFAGGEIHAPLVELPVIADTLWVLLAGGALALWRRLVSSRPERGEQGVVEFALTTVLILFAAPLGEDIHYVALLLPMTILADRVTRAGMPVVWKLLAVVACLYLFQARLEWITYEGDGVVARLVRSGAYLYGLMLIGTALITLRLRRPWVGSDRIEIPGRLLQRADVSLR